eukprot:GHVU01199952.1.p1 GENE.GHVU01199952.1~~GHVU01199952.1.p1  ORF type:complete len:194 (+),score=32.41 GHVU01199952.1:416-997(+)
MCSRASGESVMEVETAAAASATTAAGVQRIENQLESSSQKPEGGAIKGKPRGTRLPAPRREAQSNDIYVTRRRPMIVYFKRAIELLTMRSADCVYIHGLGACVKRAMFLAQDLHQHFRGQIETETSFCTVSAASLVNEGDGDDGFVDDDGDESSESAEGNGGSIPRVTQIPGIVIRMRPTVHRQPLPEPPPQL